MNADSKFVSGTSQRTPTITYETSRICHELKIVAEDFNLCAAFTILKKNKQKHHCGHISINGSSINRESNKLIIY